MLELLNSKKFLSAIIGTAFLIAIHLLFADKPDSLEYLRYTVAGLFGVQITAQGLADIGKEKAKQDKEKAIVDKEKADIELKMAELNKPSPVINMSPISTPATAGITYPWQLPAAS